MLRISAIALACACSTPAMAVNFSIGPNAPASFALGTENGLSNRTFIFDATTQSSASTTFAVTISTYDFACAMSPICSSTYPGGNVTASATYAIPSARTSDRYRLTIPSTNLSQASPVSVVFSTVGNSVISFTDVVSLTVPLVPEPSTWAMMLAGFGMVGYAMRRRVRVAYA